MFRCFHALWDWLTYLFGLILQLWAWGETSSPSVPKPQEQQGSQWQEPWIHSGRLVLWTTEHLWGYRKKLGLITPSQQPPSVLVKGYTRRGFTTTPRMRKKTVTLLIQHRQTISCLFENKNFMMRKSWMVQLPVWTHYFKSHHRRAAVGPAVAFTELTSPLHFKITLKLRQMSLRLRKLWLILNTEQKWQWN